MADGDDGSGHQPYGPDNELTTSHPRLVRARARRRRALALGDRPRQCDQRHRMGRSGRDRVRRRRGRGGDRRLFRRLVRHYVGLGFRGFRCDAAYKVPARVWRALIAAARGLAPDASSAARRWARVCPRCSSSTARASTISSTAANGGTSPAPGCSSNTMLFRAIAPSIAFPESHDTPRLAAELERAGLRPRLDCRALPPGLCLRRLFLRGRDDADGLRIRLASPPRRGGDPARACRAAIFDLSGAIAAINAVKQATPALNEDGPQRLLTPPCDPLVVLARRTLAAEQCAFILINSRRHRQRGRCRSAAGGGRARGPAADGGGRGARSRSQAAGRAARRGRLRGRRPPARSRPRPMMRRVRARACRPRPAGAS